MDINKHLKIINLTSIKRYRNKPQVSNIVEVEVEYDIPEEMPEDMIIIQNEPQKEVQKGVKKKKPKIKKATKKKGFLGKLFGGILFFICKYLHIPVD